MTPNLPDLNVIADIAEAYAETEGVYSGERVADFNTYLSDMGWIVVGWGCSRKVIRHPDFPFVVVKLPHGKYANKTNMEEYENWTHATPEQRAFMAEIYYAEPFGKFIIMEAMHGSNLGYKESDEAQAVLPFWQDIANFNGRIRYMAPNAVKIVKVVDYPY